MSEADEREAANAGGEGPRRRRIPGHVRLCDRPGCLDPARPRGRYCSNECAKAMKNVLDRERNWRKRAADRRSRS
jgi:hypothetical protein